MGFKEFMEDAVVCPLCQLKGKVNEATVNVETGSVILEMECKACPCNFLSMWHPSFDNDA